MQAEDFLEHFGVKGMRWGVRKSSSKAQKQAKARARGFGAREAAKDPKTIRGTLAARKVLLDSGQLSRKDANKGLAKMGATLAAEVALGFGLAAILTR